MNTCGLTRLLLTAFAVGFTVTSLTGDERLGWALAALTVVAILGVRRFRGTHPSCPLPPGPTREVRCAPPVDEDEAADGPTETVVRRSGRARPVRPGRGQLRSG